MNHTPGVKYLLQQDTEQSFIQRLITRLVYVFKEAPYDILEAAVPIPLLLLSLQIVNPLYSTFDSNPVTFANLQYLGSLLFPKYPELAIGLCGLAVAGVQIWACLWERPVPRFWAPFAMMIYLCMFSICLGLVNPLGTGVAVYGGLAILSLIVVLRATKGLV